jgi:hypothetical protein
MLILDGSMNYGFIVNKRVWPGTTDGKGRLSTIELTIKTSSIFVNLEWRSIVPSSPLQQVLFPALKCRGKGA